MNIKKGDINTEYIDIKRIVGNNINNFVPRNLTT